MSGKTTTTTAIMITEFLIVIFGSIFYITANIGVKKILSTNFGSKLTSADCYFITEKCLNSLQAVISTTVGIIIASSCQENMMKDTHWLTDPYCLWLIPYFPYDTFAMYQTHVSQYRELEGKPVTLRWKHFAQRNIAMLIHHIGLPVVFFPCILLRGQIGDFIIGIFYSCEVAIPFICIRFILAQLNLKHTTAYVTSGLLMIAVFFLSRICLFPFLYWRYSIHAGIPFLDVPFHIPIKCNAGCLLILVVQIYFLALMIKGAFMYFYKAYTKKKV